MKIPTCLFVKDEFNNDGDCEYSPDFTCDNCICNGGNLDPTKGEQNGKN